MNSCTLSPVSVACMFYALPFIWPWNTPTDVTANFEDACMYRGENASFFAGRPEAHFKDAERSWC
jgi:hypothetical protein